MLWISLWIPDEVPELNPSPKKFDLKVSVLEILYLNHHSNILSWSAQESGKHETKKILEIDFKERFSRYYVSKFAENLVDIPAETN